MKTKLTLTVDQNIVQKAKGHFEKKSESLSSVVEKFLKNSISKNKKHSVIDVSRGLLKGKYSRMSNKDIREEYYKEKHGI